MYTTEVHCVLELPDGDVRLVLHVSELDLASTDHGVRTVSVVVVGLGAVVHHGGEVGVVMLNEKCFFFGFLKNQKFPTL